MYAWAASVHLLRLNPVADVDPPALADKALQPPDIATIQRYIDEMRGTRYWIGLVLGAATGMRRGEFLGLCWRDVDLAKGTVTIKRGLAQIDTEVIGPQALRRAAVSASWCCQPSHLPLCESIIAP